MSKAIVPVLIQSPWLGEFNSQKAVALALVPDASRHVIIPDPFWQTPVEQQFKQSRNEKTRRQQAGQSSIQLALEIAAPLCNNIDPQSDIPVIINMGGRDSSAFLALAVKSLHPQSFLMNILYPKLARLYYDLLAISPAEQPITTKVPQLFLGAVPTAVRDDELARAKEFWSPSLCRDDKKSLAIIVGGYVGTTATNDIRPFTMEHGHELVEQVLQIHAQTNCNLFATISRRTPPDVTELLKAELGPVCFHSYFSPGETPNPYMGYLACSHAVLVTVDSMSMISEAVDAGNKVYGYYPRGVLTTDHERFYESVRNGGHIFQLPAPIEFGPGRPIRASAKIAETVIGMIASGYRPSAKTEKILSGEYAL